MRESLTQSRDLLSKIRGRTESDTRCVDLHQSTQRRQISIHHFLLLLPLRRHWLGAASWSRYTLSSLRLCCRSRSIGGCRASRLIRSKHKGGGKRTCGTKSPRNRNGTRNKSGPVKKHDTSRRSFLQVMHMFLGGSK